MTAYCAHCKKRVTVTREYGGLGRDLAKCSVCGRSWPIGRER